jgi:hypothetical protein
VFEKANRRPARLRYGCYPRIFYSNKEFSSFFENMRHDSLTAFFALQYTPRR